MKLTDEKIEELFQQAAGADEETRIRFARAIEAEVLRLNGGGGESDLLLYDDDLRFIQRVLESDAPQQDRDAAAQMVRDIRRAVRPVNAPQPKQAEPGAVPDGFVLVPEWKLRRAAEVLDKDGDEHGVGADLFAMLSAAPKPQEPGA